MPLSCPAQLPSSAEALYAEASRKAQSGDYRGAIRDLEKTVQNDPEYALAHNDLGVLYYSTGKKSRSLHHYEQAVRLQPDNITFQKNLADFYFVEENRAEDALRIYVEVLAKKPGDIDGLLATARICEKIGKVEDARDFYESVLGEDPENCEAIRWLKPIRDLEADRPLISSFEKHYNEARQYAKDGNIQVAIEKLNTLITVHPGHALLFNDLGVLYYSIGDKRSAVASYEQAVAMEQYHETALLLGELQRASIFLSSIQVRCPDNRRMRYLLIDLLLRQDNHGDAMAEIERAIVTFGIDDGILKAALAVREKTGPMESRSETTGRVNVSLCMIVKDEERDLPVCLHSVKPFVDEMIVVDTGSKDRTVAIARIFGTKVFEVTWRTIFEGPQLVHHKGDRRLDSDHGCR